METPIQVPEADAPVTTTAAEAPAPVEAAPAKAARKPRAKASAKPVAAKAKPAKAAPAKATKSTIPEGMTRSRGQLIPKATGQCGFTGLNGQCPNPGRWHRIVEGQDVLSCTTHKNSASPKPFAPAPKARKPRARKAAVAAA